jgi:hypothetical protein
MYGEKLIASKMTRLQRLAQAGFILTDAVPDDCAFTRRVLENGF